MLPDSSRYIAIPREILWPAGAVRSVSVAVLDLRKDAVASFHLNIVGESIFRCVKALYAPKSLPPEPQFELAAMATAFFWLGGWLFAIDRVGKRI